MTGYPRVWLAGGASGAETAAGVLNNRWVTPAGLAEALPYFDVRAYGATGDGTTNDAAAIQAALTAAGTSGTTLFPPGTYNIGTTGLTTTGSIWMLPGASIRYSGTGVALLVDNTDRCEYIVDIRRATVEWDDVTDTTSIGLRLKNSDYARVRATVHNFNVGIDLHGDNAGSSYGVLDCINVMDNKIGVRFSQEGTGWANQWEVRGQIRINSSYPGVSGTRYVDATDAGNNLTFINMTFENLMPEFAVELKGPYNMFLNCRWEDTNGIRLDGANTIGTMILGGYANGGPDAGFVGALPITLINSAPPPLVLSHFGSQFPVRTDGSGRGVSFVNAAAGNPPAFTLGVAATSPRVVSGSVAPENVVTAPVGSLYLRTGGGAATSFYVKESGTGNTGWVAK